MAPSPSLYDQIDQLCEEGDAYAEEGDLRGAVKLYQEAWGLVPEPKNSSDAATWILSALGDTHFGLKEYESALSALTRALACPDGDGNPFIHLRLGQCHFETGNRSQAQIELARALKESSPEIFEDEDPKYASLVLPEQ